MKRNVLCPRCNNVVKIEETKKTTKPRVGNKLCPNCKKESLDKQKKTITAQNKSAELRKKNSERMRENNPMFKETAKEKASLAMKENWIEYKKQGKTCRLADEDVRELRRQAGLSNEARKQFSERMRENNPMFDKENLAKKTETFRKKKECGEIIYKRGPEHHLWKGNRIFSELVRQILYPIWTKKILDRDSYRCTICGATNKLQVHHLKPLREFIEELKTELDIERFDDLDDEQRYKLALIIAERHKLVDGKTVCPKCHSEIDRYYNEGC